MDQLARLDNCYQTITNTIAMLSSCSQGYPHKKVVLVTYLEVLRNIFIALNWDNKPITSHASSYILSPSPPISSMEPLFAASQASKYFKQDLYWILKVALKGKTSISKIFNQPQKKYLKARVPNVYRCKSHIDCYYFILQCKNQFTIPRAKSFNQVLFITNFLKDEALF